MATLKEYALVKDVYQDICPTCSAQKGDVQYLANDSWVKNLRQYGQWKYRFYRPKGGALMNLHPTQAELQSLTNGQSKAYLQNHQQDLQNGTQLPKLFEEIQWLEDSALIHPENPPC